MKAPPSENLCPHIPPHDAHADEWHTRRALIRRELRRHQLSDSERRVAEIILDLSLGQGLEKVIVPNLDCFKALTGIDRPHLSEAIKALREMRIVRLSSTAGAPTYAIREDPDSDGLVPFNWRVQPRMTLNEMSRSLDLVREYNSLPPLPKDHNLEALANFKNRAVTKKTAAAVPENGMTRGNDFGFHAEDQPHLF
jgi:hypothetical protein